MSALPRHNDQHAEPEEAEQAEHAEQHPEGSPVGGPSPVVVRRRMGLSAPIGAAAAAVSIAYLWRATETGAALDWAMSASMAVVAAFFLVALLDARTPVLVADPLGVRLRLGAVWRGLPWEAVDRVAVDQPRALLRDGRLVVVPCDPPAVLDDLDVRARRRARANRRMYGASLAVPLGLVTRVDDGRLADLADRIAALTQGRTDVVSVVEEDPTEETEQPAASPEKPHVVTPSESRARVVSGLGTIVSRVAKGRSHDLDAAASSEPAAEPERVAPSRETRPALRVDATLPRSPDLPPAHEDVELVSESSPAPPNVRPIARLGDPVEPLVIDDFETRPAYDPVIGPELVAARHRVGLTVDELAERTRIRPHVIEAIEVDDFAPCGGDVYARGHLRTIARVLGKDPEPMLAAFDSRYAAAPISARRVFEAELATGMTGSMRSTVGGPNWGLLVGVVLTLVMLWGLVRLFAGSPAQLVEEPPALPEDHSGSVYSPRNESVAPVRSMRLKLVALNAATHVSVRDGEGTFLVDRRLELGEQVTLRGAAPLRVTAADGGAVSVKVAGRDDGPLGEPDQPTTRVFAGPG